MAMTPAGLAAALQAQFGAATDAAIQSDVLLKFATAIVEYIQTNGTVAVTGVTVGTGAAAGTIT